MKKLVIVESPAKAKTINKYLGKDYDVIASYGHIRDLPSKDGSVDPEKNFAMVWESEARAKKQIKNILEKAKQSDEIILATDPDREGEAISWHIYDIIKADKKLKDIPIKRVVFHEITKKAINEAMANPRDVDEDLVNAYLARRALDYLVGFTLSPVLWRKLPGSKSAGRVQSVALRLIADRELEIDKFKKEEYWTIEGEFKKQGSDKKSDIFNAKMTHLLGQKLEKFTINSKEKADDALSKIDKASFAITNIEKKEKKRNPYAPFITSTLQQDASRKLGFSAKKTMMIAQKLYEGIKVGQEVTGLITYMRTDSINLAAEAIDQIRDKIKSDYGDSYLPKSPRVFKSKSKNAQEAHEAIRPTNIKDLPPQKVKAYLDDDQFKLYELIYKRTVASQMESAILDQVAIDITDKNKNTFRATGSTIRFDGFLKVYEEAVDIIDSGAQKKKSAKAGAEEKILPQFDVGEGVDVIKISPEQHFTQPPPRYTEASLVKKLEELGIGRPSTYASIISTLQDRKYVRLEKKQFIPEPRGRVVIAFLEGYFKKYVEYDFTANLEEQLDEIANHKLDWLKVLNDFWGPFKGQTEEAMTLKNSDIVDFINDILEVSVFGDDKDSRKCPKCGDGKLTIKLGRYGAFIGCSRHPECDYIKKWDKAGDGDDSQDADENNQKNYEVFEPKLLGKDPISGEEITLRKGPYGFYFQWDKSDEDKSGKKTSTKVKPKRAALPKGLNPDEATIEHALKVGALPRNLGIHPETKQELIANVGRYGPYVKHGSKFISIKGKYDPTDITLDQAIELVNNS